MSDPETYDLAPDPADAQPDAPPAGRVADAAPTLAYQTVHQRDRASYDVTEGDPLRNLYVPIALLLIGCAAVFGRMMYFRPFGAGAAGAAGAWWWTGFMLAWNVGVMLLGAYAIAQFTGMSFGPLSTATVKLAAITVAPHAVIFLFELMIVREFHTTLLGWLVSGAIVWWLFVFLFDFDFQEALICAGVTTVMRWFSYLVYWLS
jgi:hypothetical protein